MASSTPLGENKYKIFVELGYDEKGKRIRKTKTVTAKSDRALKKLMTEFEIEVSNSQNLQDVENITFKAFVQRWFEMYVIPDLSVKTNYLYQNYLFNGGIIEELGNLKISKVKTFHIVKYFNGQKAAGKGSLREKFEVLKSIFSRAIKWNVIKENPMIGVDRPITVQKHREINFYDEEQLKHLIKVLDRVYPKHRIQIKLAALVGLRMGEIAGIRIENINFNDNTILIDKTLQRDNIKRVFVLGPTKTKKPRTVNVPAAFMLEIKEFVKEQKKLKMKCGSAWSPMKDENEKPIHFLFTNEIGYPNHPFSMTKEWRKIISRHDLPPLNFHGLRHTCASFMVNRNVNFKIIQEQLGHKDIKETLNTYSHLSKKDKAKAADLFNELLL